MPVAAQGKEAPGRGLSTPTQGELHSLQVSHRLPTHPASTEEMGAIPLACHERHPPALPLQGTQEAGQPCMGRSLEQAAKPLTDNPVPDF